MRMLTMSRSCMHFVFHNHHLQDTVRAKIGREQSGSTGPGRLKEIVKGPTGHSCWTLIWYALESFSIAPFDITPWIWTFPSRLISHFTLPVRTSMIYLVIFRYFILFNKEMSCMPYINPSSISIAITPHSGFTCLAGSLNRQKENYACDAPVSYLMHLMH